MSFFAAVDGDAEDGAELGATELRHQRGTLTGDGFLVLGPGHRERRRVVDRLRRVQVGPPGGESELAGGLGVLDVAGGLDRGEQVGG
ncbi:hypothetical protein [Nocardioides eburneiflavus]|uniref:hypothetical protein n=1 Tax=Nocardioides eburneiflavus TaxID=2518372 RepID=UPI00143D8134|nr:hypothetical protein [Nocardioides eburneiflavus]